MRNLKSSASTPQLQTEADMIKARLEALPYILRSLRSIAAIHFVWFVWFAVKIKSAGNRAYESLRPAPLRRDKRGTNFILFADTSHFAAG